MRGFLADEQGAVGDAADFGDAGEHRVEAGELGGHVGPLQQPIGERGRDVEIARIDDPELRFGQSLPDVAVGIDPEALLALIECLDEGGVGPVMRRPEELEAVAELDMEHQDRAAAGRVTRRIWGVGWPSEPKWPPAPTHSTQSATPSAKGR